MDRRKTMSGLVGSSGMNSRIPGPAGRMGQKGDMAPPPPKLDSVQRGMGRMSLAGPVQRRSSAYTTTVKAPPGVKADPRPVGDKAYQAACGRTIVAFLAKYGYEHQVTAKTLASPTTKDYTNIMLFIARCIDPSMVKNFTKIEEEVPQLYKRLKYPFTISKSNLTAVGSPHTWPTILASLAWLVELLNYCDRAEDLRMEACDEKAKADADFFEYVSTSYKHFMAGEDHLCEELEARKGEEIQNKSKEFKENVQKLEGETAALREKIEALRVAPRPLKEAQDRLHETIQDREKFLKLVENLQSHHSSLVRKLAEKKTDISSQQRELEMVEQENEELRSKIAAQTVHPADVMRMNQEKAKHESALTSLSQHRRGVDTKATTMEEELSQKFDEIEMRLEEYSMLAHKLQLIPATAKRAEGFVFETRLDRTASSGSLMIHLDFKGIVKPVLQRIKDAYMAKARELGKEELSLAEKCDSMKLIVAERADENAHAEAQVRDMENQYRQSKEELEADVAAALSHVEDIANEVASIRGACNAGVMESEERLRCAHAEFEDLQRICELENNTLHRDLAAALEMILNHKVAIQAKIKSAEERVMTSLDEVESISIPAV